MRLNTIQLLTNSSHMMSIIFIPLLAESLGASYFEIGVISAVFGASSFVSSFIFGKVADIHRLRIVVMIGLAAGAITFFLQVFAYDFLSLAIIRGLAGFSVGMYPAALIAYVHYQERSIGKFSSFGSLGWLTGYLLAGLIGNIQYLFVISSLFYCFALFSAFGLKDIEKPALDVSYFSVDTFTRNISIYLSLFIRHTGAVSVWTILPLYLIELGANTFWIGMIYAINPALQFLIMRRLEGLRNEKLVVWGHLLSVLAFIAYILAPSFPYIIPGMLLVGFSWSFLYVGSTQLAVERNPDKATAAGLINSMIGAAGITGALLGGMLLEVYGFKATLLAGAVLSLLSFVIFRVFDHPTDGLHNFNKIY